MTPVDKELREGHPAWRAMDKMKIKKSAFRRLVGWDILTDEGMIICDSEYTSPRMAETISPAPGVNAEGHRLRGLGD